MGQKQLLQLASVIGREFTALLLDRISDLEDNLDQVLGELKVLELIYQEAYFPELAFMFKHALTQDVTYRTLLRERRKTLHHLIGKAIEELYAGRLSEQVEVLAHHYYTGESWEKAFQYLVLAGDKSAAAFANQDALDYYARALEVGDILEPTSLEKIADVASKRGMVNVTIADYGNAISDFGRMQNAAKILKDTNIEGMALTLRGLAESESHQLAAAENSLLAALEIAGDKFVDISFLANCILAITLKIFNRHKEANNFYESAIKLAPLIEDPSMLSWWRLVGPTFPMWEGRFDEALAIHDSVDEIDEDADHVDINGSWFKALALGGRGRYQQALNLLESIYSSCERIGENNVRVRVLNTLGWIYGELQDHNQALKWNRLGIIAAQEAEFPDPEVESNARLNLADNMIALGHLDKAEEQFQTVDQVVRNPRPQDHYSLWRYSQHHFHSYGELWLARNKPQKALSYADECLILAENSDSRKNIVKGRRLRGQAFMALGQLAQAEKELTTAMDVAQQVGNPTQLWQTFAAMGDLYALREHLNDARQSYQEALDVFDRVAAGLDDTTQREILFASAAAQEIARKRNEIG